MKKIKIRINKIIEIIMRILEIKGIRLRGFKAIISGLKTASKNIKKLRLFAAFLTLLKKLTIEERSSN